MHSWGRQLGKIQILTTEPARHCFSRTKIIPGPKLIFQNLLVHSQPPGCRGLRQVPPPPLLQYQPFVLPSGQVAKVSRLYLSADVSNKHPQILGGLCQHTVISHTTALWVRWGFRSKTSLLQDPGCRGSPSGGTTAEEMRQIGTSSRSLCLLRPLPLPFHWLKQVTWPGPIFKRVGECDLFLWQEFWQMASVTPLHTSRSCPSVTGVPTVPLGRQFSEPSMECSYTSLPMVCVPRIWPMSLTFLLYSACIFSPLPVSVSHPFL